MVKQLTAQKGSADAVLCPIIRALGKNQITDAWNEKSVQTVEMGEKARNSPSCLRFFKR